MERKDPPQLAKNMLYIKGSSTRQEGKPRSK